MGQEGSLQPSPLTCSLMHPNFSLLTHSKDIASVDGDRLHTYTLHLPCMSVTNISTIANSDKDIATTLHLPCITDTVCILPVTSRGNHDFNCLPPVHAMSACISPSGTVI